MDKTRVGILFGGRSGEHEVSLLSAASVMKAIDKQKYEVVPIGITKDGHWLTATDAERLLKGETAPNPQHLRAGDPAETVGAAMLQNGEAVLVPPVPGGEHTSLLPFQTTVEGRRAADRPIVVDVIFPVLHGTFGEDGTIQGLLELADIAYVGAGVLGSSAGMDKDVMKALFKYAGLPIVKHVTILRREWERDAAAVEKRVEAALSYPMFVKPANLGSSVGISKAHDHSELGPAIREAALFDRKIVIEEGVGREKKARELECAVLGNDDAQASVVGEVVPIKEFYDYAAKYLDEGSELIIPAKLSGGQEKSVREMAVKAFKAVDCAGLARVDFLMDPVSNEIFVNEINTLPGFTSISMYPKLWGATGVGNSELIDKLIQLALERYREKKQNRYTK
jgi:D-alanine-D-alanine ligase